jgi:hypothetical protein
MMISAAFHENENTISIKTEADPARNDCRHTRGLVCVLDGLESKLLASLRLHSNPRNYS